MISEARPVRTSSTTSTEAVADLLEQYGCGPIQLSGHSDALYERHLLFDDVVDPLAAGARDALLSGSDHYMHLADLQSYLEEADHRLTELYADENEWARKTMLNVACSGKFSSDRTIAQYAAEIWNANPCPVA